MHIKRGDNRQYFQQQAGKNFAGDVANLINEGLNTAVLITQKANESTLANNQIQLANDFYKKNNEINTKYQANPDNPEREKELKSAFEELANSYEINPVCQGQWNTLKNNVYNNFKMRNTQWAEQQKDTNAKINLSNAYKTSLYQFATLGRDGASVDDVRLLYANNETAMRNGTINQLGEIVVGEALKDYRHNVMSSYIDGIIERNPAQALKLLEDKSVQNDLQNADTIKKLQQAARAKMIKQVQIEAVDRTARYINKNHDIFSKALDGTITTAEAQEFLSDKNVDRNMRDILSNMLGYSSKDDLWVDRETGEIHSEKENKAKNEAVELVNDTYSTLVLGDKYWSFATSNGKLRQPTTHEKEDITTELYLEGSRLLNGIEGKTPQQQIRKIAEFQSKLAQANYFGIDRSDYNKLMNDFVLPATSDIQANAQKYNANISSWNPGSGKYGWEQIDKYFNKMKKDLGGKSTKTDKELIAKEKALASVYYWSALNNYASQQGISMNDICGLSREAQGEIYNKAAQEAIKKAKINTQTPQLWFRSANPQYVGQIRNLLPNDNADNVITSIAVASMSNSNMSDKDFDILVNREVQKEYARMRTSNKSIVFNGNTKYDDYINNYATMYKIDPLLIKAVIKHESGFNPNAESKVGAGGLMQLMPATARGLGVKNIKDPKQNIAGGTKYLANLLKQFDGNVPLALAAYNAGPNAVKKYGNEIPPYKETQNYVKSIMATYNSIKG